MRVHHHIRSGMAFAITPMLDRGWGYDPYVQRLIGRIRAGRPALPSLFDNNSLFLRSGMDSELQRPAIKKREISVEEMAAYRADEAKRKAALDVLYAEQRAKAKADREAREVERKREEKAWRARQAAIERQKVDAETEWNASHPPPRPSEAGPFGYRRPLAGWWKKAGDDVWVAVMLHRHTDDAVLVGPEGAGMWIAKFQIKEVKNYLNGQHELRLDGALAKQLGFCKGEPARWD